MSSGERAFHDALGPSQGDQLSGQVSTGQSRMHQASDILGMPVDALEHALMCAWNESQLDDDLYTKALGQRVGGREQLNRQGTMAPTEHRSTVDKHFDELKVRDGRVKVPADNWKHRSQGMRCSSCMYYVPKVGRPVSDEAAIKLLEGRGPVGRCRRHAPLAAGGGWPVMYAADWCGDHKIDEEKLGADQ
jgi:hypothetical protein